MESPRYDAQADFYVAFVDRMLADPDSFWHPILKLYDVLLGDVLPGADVLEVACGEGYLSRRLALRQPREVLGIDLSGELLRVAQDRANSPLLQYRQDDAQTLASVPDRSVDVVIIHLALMDIPDHRTVFHSVRRVLRSGGRLFSRCCTRVSRFLTPCRTSRTLSRMRPVRCSLSALPSTAGRATGNRVVMACGGALGRITANCPRW